MSYFTEYVRTRSAKVSELYICLMKLPSNKELKGVNFQN